MTVPTSAHDATAKSNAWSPLGVSWRLAISSPFAPFSTVPHVPRVNLNWTGAPEGSDSVMAHRPSGCGASAYDGWPGFQPWKLPAM